jgi:Mn2+/Fe2+ NRAMP family transporter
VGETLHWRVGLARKPREAASFYGVLAAATLLGAGITLTPLNPIQALYWSAVINGVVAVPVMIVMMFIASSPKAMGKLTVGG